MWRYWSYMYILSLAVVKWVMSVCAVIADTCIWSSALSKRVASVCAIITDTSIYCRQRQFMQKTIYADDNSCNMYCRRRQFMQATIYAVTDLLLWACNSTQAEVVWMCVETCEYFIKCSIYLGPIPAHEGELPSLVCVFIVITLQVIPRG